MKAEMQLTILEDGTISIQTGVAPYSATKMKDGQVVVRWKLEMHCGKLHWIGPA